MRPSIIFMSTTRSRRLWLVEYTFLLHELEAFVDHQAVRAAFCILDQPIGGAHVLLDTPPYEVRL